MSFAMLGSGRRHDGASLGIRTNQGTLVPGGGQHGGKGVKKTSDVAARDDGAPGGGAQALRLFVPSHTTPLFCFLAFT
jgi:hypothetical protein